MKNIVLIKENKKCTNIVNVICSILILLIGLVFFMKDIITFSSRIELFYVVMFLYFGIMFIDYLFTRENKDYNSLFTSLACIIASLSGIKYINDASNIVLSMTMLGWFIIMIIIKLIRIEEYRSKLNIATFVNLFCLSIFILLGILTVVNLYKADANENLTFGFFYIVNGVLYLIEILANIRINKKNS